ncbi:MAG TPA: hypothetical protein VL171_08425 [Verrucomicrobiae bacterium]|nr:hypothetical protein [Verrucomicrobiae bacterium]
MKAIACTVLISLGISTLASAQTNSWINPTRGYWDDYTKWSLDVAPTNSQTVYITNDVSKTVTIDDFTSGVYPETLTVSNLFLSAPAGATNTLELVDAGTITPLYVLDTFSVSSGGLVRLTGSALLTRSLTNGLTNCFLTIDGPLVASNSWLAVDSGIYVGVETNANGSVSLVDGQLILSEPLQYGITTTNSSPSPSAIGIYGNGQMTISNSQVQAPTTFLLVGAGSGSQGTLTVVGGNTSFSPYSRLVVGMESNARGVVTFSSAQFAMTNSLITLVGGDGTGQLNLLGGTNTFGPMEIGASAGSQGTFTMTGSKSVFQQALIIGANLNATGTVWMNGGNVVQTNLYLVSGMTNRWPTYVGEWGSGRLTLSNANWLGGAMIVGTESNGNGVVNLIGSTTTLLTNLVAGSCSNSMGIVNLIGGSLAVTNAGIYVGESGTGQVSAANTSVLAGDVLVGNAPGSSGNLLLNNNSSLVASGIVSVGESGFGQMNVAAATMQASNLIVANGANSSGEIVFDSNSTLIADGGIYVAGDTNASGYFWFKNSGVGAISNYPADVGIGIGGLGQAVISNSTFRSSGSTIVGSSAGSQGTLTVVNGDYVFSPNSRLLIGMESGATGIMTLTNGNLVMTNALITLIGGSGSGQLTLPGGTNTLGTVEVGGNPGSSGTFTIAGGFNTLEVALSVGASPQATGTVWLTGGQLIATNLTTCVASWGYGLVTVSNGNWLGNNVSLGLYSNALGAVDLNSGATTFLSSLLIGNCPSGGVGVVNVSGGNLYVTNAGHNAFIDVRQGQLNLNGGVLQTDNLVITNPCALFVRSGGTLIVSNLVLDPNLDADGDGIANGWEQAHGLDPLDASDAHLDPDGDGFSNLQESLAGTDPLDSASAFRIKSILPEGNDLRITWSVSTGKTYDVQAMTNLVGGDFTNLATVNVPATPAISETNYLDAGAVTNGEPRFYRIKLNTP